MLVLLPLSLGLEVQSSGIGRQVLVPLSLCLGLELHSSVLAFVKASLELNV